MYKYNIKLGGVIFSLLSERPLRVDDYLADFLVFDVSPDVTVHVSWDWDASRLPSSKPIGEDILCYYYKDGERFCCLTRGGVKGAVAISLYKEDYSEIFCYMNEKPFISIPNNIGGIIRMLPIRAVFQKFGVMFFHAAQIVYRDRGILFSAPSGTGKTTQAKLWRDLRGAEIVCGDRTLVRCVNNEYVTFGYPLDGSQPVRTGKIFKLGAIVIPEQGMSNFVERLNPFKGAYTLMPQTVIDTWNAEMRSDMLQKILTLMESIPIYRLVCTPDFRAVDVLEQKIKNDGVI